MHRREFLQGAASAAALVAAGPLGSPPKVGRVVVGEDVQYLGRTYPWWAFTVELDGEIVANVQEADDRQGWLRQIVLKPEWPEGKGIEGVRSVYVRTAAGFAMPTRVLRGDVRILAHDEALSRKFGRIPPQPRTRPEDVVLFVSPRNRPGGGSRIFVVGDPEAALYLFPAASGSRRPGYLSWRPEAAPWWWPRYRPGPAPATDEHGCYGAPLHEFGPGPYESAPQRRHEHHVPLTIADLT